MKFFCEQHHTCLDAMVNDIVMNQPLSIHDMADILNAVKDCLNAGLFPFEIVEALNPRPILETRGVPK